MRPARHSEAAIGGPVLRALVTVGCALALVQCERKEPESAPPAPVPAPPPAPAPILPPPSPVARAELIAAMNAAASDFAAGETGAARPSLAGRRFAIVIPFGCGDPAPPPKGGAVTGVAHAYAQPKGKGLELRLQPADFKDVRPVAQAVEADVWEAVEGFWIPRPWLTANACPSPAPPPVPAPTQPPAPRPTQPPAPVAEEAAPRQTADRQTVGLAAVFAPGGSRFERRNSRAYSFLVRPGDGGGLETPPPYRVVLEGRMASFPSGRAIACDGADPDRRPVCVAAIQLDRVAFETMDGKALSEWRRS